MLISLLIHILKLMFAEVTIDYCHGNRAFILYCCMFLDRENITMKKNFSNDITRRKQLQQQQELSCFYFYMLLRMERA